MKLESETPGLYGSYKSLAGYYPVLVSLEIVCTRNYYQICMCWCALEMLRLINPIGPNSSYNIVD